MTRDEKGFSLLNLAVAIAISAIIAAGAGMTTVQLLSGPRYSRDGMTAIRHARNVGYWLGKDILMAHTVTTTDDPETGDIEFVILSWKDWETGDTHDIRYIWLDSAEHKKLMRKQITRNADGGEIINKTTLVADNIYTATLTPEGDCWILNVEARSGDKCRQQEYKLSQRVESQTG